jgi:glycosyltransferase involved in cell wall biosynthesis
MKFAIDAHAIGQKLTGNEVYIRNLLSCFAHQDGDSDFLAYISTPEALPVIPAGFRTETVSTNPFIRLGAEIPFSLLRERPDLLHVQYTSPLVCSAPIVVSVHDVSFLEYPSYFSRARAMQLQITVKRTVHAAARILTPSAFSRRSVARAYNLDPERISVIHNGVSPQFRPVPQETAATWLLRHKDVAWPFVLTVGDLQPRKNHLGLIKAFENVIRTHPELPHRLVFAGKDTWFSPTVRAAAQASSVADRIVFLGFVTDEDLTHYYSACDVFMFPSFYEGFGIPILEAMACGRAVGCSNTSAMPEVADSAALLFDPQNTDQMGRALKDLLIDPQLRARMGRLGLQRSTLFHWNRAAEETLAAYYSVASESRARSMAAKSVPVPRS